MNTLFTRFAYPAIAVLALASAFAAHAESPMPESQAAAAPSGITRAQVQQELFQARKDGSLRVYSTSYNPLTAAKSTLTREEVRAQVLIERNAAALAANHEVPSAALTGEDSGSFYLARLPANREASRALAAR